MWHCVKAAFCERTKSHPGSPGPGRLLNIIKNQLNVERCLPNRQKKKDLQTKQIRYACNNQARQQQKKKKRKPNSAETGKNQ